MITAAHPRPAASGAVTRVADEVACIRLSIVNVYLVGRPGAVDRDWVLIDAGLATSARRIMAAAADRFGPHARPAAIILTHGHFDHVGALPRLAEHWGAPIYAHPLELPYLTGRSSYPPPDPAVGGGGMSLLSRFYPRGPIHLGNRVRPLPDDGSVPGMPGWRWIHTPGHTQGHIALFRDSDRTLIAGDAFVTTAQESLWEALVQPRHVSRPPAYYTTDWPAARASIAALADLEPEIAATGHGAPMSGEPLRRQLHDLLQNFQARAVPRHGRYVNRPALADETGVVSVPPPVPDPQLRSLVATGIALGLGAFLLSRAHAGTDRRRPALRGTRAPGAHRAASALPPT